jgi:hypothetical protein
MPYIAYIAKDPLEIRIGRSDFTYEFRTIRQVNNWYRGQLKERLGDDVFAASFLVVPRGRDPAEFLAEWEAAQKPKRGRGKAGSE